MYYLFPLFDCYEPTTAHSHGSGWDPEQPKRLSIFESAGQSHCNGLGRNVIGTTATFWKICSRFPELLNGFQKKAFFSWDTKLYNWDIPCLSPTIAHLLSQKQILHCCNFLPRHSSNLFIDINMGFILFLHILTVVPNGITSKNCIPSHLAEELSCALCTHRVQRRRRCSSRRWGCNNVVESTTSTNL